MRGRKISTIIVFGLMMLSLFFFYCGEEAEAQGVVFIVLTDAPNGSALENVTLQVGEQVTAYASGYNASGGYVGLVDVNWYEAAGLGSFDNLTGKSTTFTAGIVGGTTTITGDNKTMTPPVSDDFVVNILSPFIDYIVITYSPNGLEMTTVTLPIWENVTAYASGYNASAGAYIDLVEVNWSGSGGFWSPGTGKSSTFYAFNTPNVYTQTGANMTYPFLYDTFDVKIINYTLDFINITDAPNGINLTTVTLAPGEKITAYASGYNYTFGYYGLVYVSWSQSPELGEFDTPIGTFTTFTAGLKGGTTTITGKEVTGPMNDTFDVIITSPSIDNIIITDAPNGAELKTVILTPGENVTAYASGYDSTGDYIDLVEVNWSESMFLGFFDNITGTSTTFTAGAIGGLTTITGENLSYPVNDTFDVNIINATVDYIQIRDEPKNGGSVVTNLTLDVGQSFTLWAAAYNYSFKYMADFASTTWTETSGGSVITVTSLGASTNVQAQLIGGTSTITADYKGVQNMTNVTVNPPTADYIQIRTQPGGTGINLCDLANYKSYPVGASDIYYGAMYNHTASYFADVPGTATWFSSNLSIVKVTSPGPSSNITCDDQKWGGPVTITLSASGKQNTTLVTVLEPTVDYIQIRDEPNGLGNIVKSRTYIVWQEEKFYAAGYNNTADYLSEVMALWWSDDPSVGTVTSPGLWTDFKAQKVDSDSTCHLTADYNGIENFTGDLTVLAPRIDFIIIRDSPNGGGDWVADMTYNEGDKDVFWAAGYNLTADYVKDVEATWESNNTVVGKVTYGPSQYTDFSAGWRGGYCRVRATYGTLKNGTGPLFVINVNQLPTARADYYYETGFAGGNFSFPIDITLRVTGRKKNIITMELEEDGVVVESVDVTRHSNQPDVGMISYEIDVHDLYEVVLSYNGHNGGSNPIIVTFDFLGNIYSVHLLFNSQHGQQQKAIIDFNDILKLVGVVFFDGFNSTDFEGYLVDYGWDFGDGTLGNGETLAHTYEENGIYTITLTVTDDEEGTDDITITVEVDSIDDNNQANAIPSQKASKGYLNFSGQYAVILQCPADLLITNIENQQIGLLDKSQINDIEGAFIAMLYSDVEVYYIPVNETYTCEVMGSGSGLYNLSLIGVDNNVVKKYGFYNVTCSENTLDIYIFDFREDKISISTNEDDKSYSLEFLISIEDDVEHFNLMNMRLDKNSVHIYEINDWGGLSSNKPVTLSIDEDNDGKIDKSIDLETGLTGDEVEALLIRGPVTEPAFPILLFVMVGFFCAIGVGGLLTEVGKWALLIAFLPLYTRLKKEELLDQPTRYKIYGYIIGNPGAHFGLIKEDLELGSGQLVYHLKQLQDAHLVYSRQDGVKKRFYPAHVPKPKGGARHFSDIQEKILGIIKNNSGIGQKRLASSMGISRQVAGYHLTIMERKGLIYKEVVGRERRYYTSKSQSV